MTTERLARVTKLYRGSHSPDGHMCLMEAVAYVAGEDWTDSPECTSPVLAAYGRVLNDEMNDDERQRLIPYITRLIGTRASLEVDLRRAFVLADAAVRVLVPMALRGATESAVWGKALEAFSSAIDIREEAKLLEGP